MNNKNWIGNEKSTFSTLGASSHTEKKRGDNDFYATDPIAIDMLFAKQDFADNIWEPACGTGHLSKRMQEFGKNVFSTDIVDRGFGVGNIDFLEQTKPPLSKIDIITNPPYKYALEFVQTSLELLEQNRKVAMFLKLTFLEGQKRKQFFLETPPKNIYVFSKRIQCARNGEEQEFKMSSAVCYSWFVWEKGINSKPIIDWI